MEKAKVRFERYCNDNETLVIVCNECNSKGEPMSRNWNYDAKNGAWEPQARHIPECTHTHGFQDKCVKINSESLRQTAYLPNGTPPSF